MRFDGLREFCISLAMLVLLAFGLYCMLNPARVAALQNLPETAYTFVTTRPALAADLVMVFLLGAAVFALATRD